MNYLKISALLLTPVLAGSLFTSCVSKKKYEEATQSREAYRQQTLALQEQVSELESDKAALNSRIARLSLTLQEEQELRAMLQERNQDLAVQVQVVDGLMQRTSQQVEAVERELQSSLKEQEGHVAVEIEQGEIHLGVDDYLVFPTNSAQLHPQGREVLDEVAQVLNDHPNMMLTVEGHTDSRAFPEDSPMDNWTLSVQRGASVVRYLEENGVRSEQLRPAGRSHYDPDAKNASVEGRSDNRRTEIIIEPNFQPLFDRFYPENMEAKAQSK